MTIPTREDALKALDTIDHAMGPWPIEEEARKTLRSYIESHTGEPLTHEWHERFGLTCCKVCGFVRNENSDAKGCRGPVYVSLRDASPVQPDPALTEALTRIEELEAENKDLKSSVVAFGAVHAVRHAKDYGLPEGHLEAVHYDILSRAGARMVDFKRHDSATLTQGIKE